MAFPNDFKNIVNRDTLNLSFSFQTSYTQNLIPLDGETNVNQAIFNLVAWQAQKESGEIHMLISQFSLSHSAFTVYCQKLSSTDDSPVDLSE